MTDCEKYKEFVETNYMLEFIIWENEIKPRFENGNNNDTTTDITDFDINIVD